MFRKLLAIAILAALLYVAFHLSRSVRHEEDLVATLIFDAAAGVTSGTGVTEKGERIGEVTTVGTVGEKAAITVAIPLEHRNRIFSDSVFAIEGEPVEIRVMSSISVGAPLADGAVVVVRPDRFSKFLARGGEKLAPHLAAVRDRALEAIGDYDSDMFRKQLDEWSGKVPEWKAEGKDVLKKNVAELEDTVSDIEVGLRKIRRDAEADRIRKAFDDWVEDVNR